MPPPKSTLGILSRAVFRLEQMQMPASLSGVGGLLFDSIGPDMPILQKALFANRWLFGKLILSQLAIRKATNAMIRTTTAPTIIHGGVKENVLPTQAYALVNFRILPGDTVDKVVEHAEQTVDDPHIKISLHGKSNGNPSPISSTESLGFMAIKKTIQQLFPGTSVAPGLVLAGTDSKHYVQVADNCYRFAPVIFGPEDPARIHGTNERVEINGYIKSIQYYIQLMQTVGNGDL